VTGSFILIDPASNATVGAGMIREVLTTASHAQEQMPRIVLGEPSLLENLEQRLLDLEYPVVRTRVQDHGVWRALHEAGVIVLVESQQLPQVVSGSFTLEPAADASVEGLLAALDISAGEERA